MIESAGKATAVTLTLEGVEMIRLDMKPFEITTLKIKRGNKGVTIKPCGLIDAA